MKDEYFLTDLILTFFLLVSVTLLLKEAISIYWLYLVFIICGFWFSYFFKDKENELIKFFVTVATFVVLAWMAYSILNSSFLYKDVILICIKGALFLEIILSFNVCWDKSRPSFRANGFNEGRDKYLAYMQALSIPLFMCFPVVIKNYNAVSIITILGYFICWMVTLKVKFYEFFNKPKTEINFRHNYSTVLLAAIFIISLCVSGVLFFKLPFRKVIKGGIFPQYVDMEGTRENIEKEYYDLQEKLQKKISELSSKLGSAEDGYSVLGSLSSLIKESSAVKETEKAQQELISHLNTPGLGLEKGEGKDSTIILKNFVDKKAALNLKRTIDDMMNALKENPFNIKARITIGALANKIQNSNSPQQLSGYEKQLKEAIDNSSLDTSVKKELKELARQLKEWKGFQFQQRKMYSEGKIFEKEEIKEAPVEQILPPSAKEYPQALEKYPQTKSPSFNLAVTIDSLIKIALKWALILILCIPILFLVLYFLTEKQKNKLISLCKNPREFIINLYGNLREVLIIFGLRYSEILAPLSYAEWVEHRYSIKNNLFLRFTAKFEEAKYSQHILKFEDVSLVLNDYNGFLKVLFSNQKKFYLVLRYCLTLLHRKPLSIHKG